MSKQYRRTTQPCKQDEAASLGFSWTEYASYQNDNGNIPVLNDDGFTVVDFQTRRKLGEVRKFHCPACGTLMAAVIEDFDGETIDCHSCGSEFAPYEIKN